MSQPTDVPSLVAAALAERKAGRHAESLAFFQAALELQPDHVGVRMEAARDLLALERAAEAEEAYRAVLAREPARVEAMIGLGQAVRRSGPPGAALDHFRAASAADPEHVWARMEAAVELRAASRVDEAEAEYRRVLAAYPAQATALLGLAACARQRGDFAGSLDWHRAAVAAEPANVWARLQEAADLLELGRTLEAEAGYHRILAIDPRAETAMLGLGQCARRRGERVCALAWHMLAEAANPANDWCRIEHAVDLRELGRFEEARRVLLPMLERLPAGSAGAVPVLLGLARVERAAGKRAAGTGYLQRAVTASPLNVEAALDLAADRREQGEIDAARALAEGLLAGVPDCAAAWISIGHTEREAGRHDWALTAFTRAAEGHGKRAELLGLMAAEAQMLGRQAQADALLAEGLELEPGNPSLLLQKGELARAAGDIARMHEVYADAVKLHPDHLGLSLELAEALVLLGRTDAALAHLAEAEARFGLAPALAGRRAFLLRRIGRWAEALAAARRLTAAHPQDANGWLERLASECLMGSATDIDACLAQVPAHTPRDRARLAAACAQIRQDRGAWTEAAADYALARRLDPDHSEAHFLYTRFCLSTLDLEGAREGLSAFMRVTSAPARAASPRRHASQTHFGQLLDEYALDGPAVAAVLGARAQAGGERVEALLAAMRAHPHSTAAAVGVMHALRDMGLIGAPNLAGEGGESRIPRQIVQFWDTAAVPGDVAGHMATWQDANPGWQVRRFSDAAAVDYIQRAYGPLAGGIYARIAGPAQKADVFRLALLAREGGVYADSDDRCHAPLESILPPRARLVLYQEDFGTLGNNFIAAAPGHPVIVHAFNLAMASMARGDAETVWLSTGPALMTRAVAGVLAAAGAGWRGWFDYAVLLERRELFKAVAIHCLTGYKSAGRHWSTA